MANLATWERHDFKRECPVEEDRRVEVMWRDGKTTTRLAGAINWENVAAYKLAAVRK